MYIHLGRDYVLNDRDIIGIFNLETTTISPRGREFLIKQRSVGYDKMIQAGYRSCRSCRSLHILAG